MFFIDFERLGLAEVLARINNFFSTKFADYRKKVEAVQVSLFKPYTPLEVE
ncbi:hypothetical protein [Haliscomenobacter sp.]|uniref:hypothetical protein n=1 Tax=Haliscomenobacter sp. TaxID=2717303 RepID=UPI0035934754